MTGHEAHSAEVAQEGKVVWNVVLCDSLSSVKDPRYRQDYDQFFCWCFGWGPQEWGGEPRLWPVKEITLTVYTSFFGVELREQRIWLMGDSIRKPPQDGDFRAVRTYTESAIAGIKCILSSCRLAQWWGQQSGNWSHCLRERQGTSPLWPARGPGLCLSSFSSVSPKLLRHSEEGEDVTLCPSLPGHSMTFPLHCL